jgi:hypothetical protein
MSTHDLSAPATLPYAYGAGAMPGAPQYTAAGAQGGGDTCAGLLGLAALGAVIGGAAAAGADLRLLQRDEITGREALADIGRAVATSAAATAIAGAVATAVSRQGMLRLAVLFGAGAAVTYALQRHLEQD